MTGPKTIIITVWKRYVDHFREWTASLAAPGILAVAVALIPPVFDVVGWALLLFLEIGALVSADRLLSNGRVLDRRESNALGVQRFVGYLWASILYNLIVGLVVLVAAAPLIYLILQIDIPLGTPPAFVPVALLLSFRAPHVLALLLVVIVGTYASLRLAFVKPSNVLHLERGVAAVRRSISLTAGRTALLFRTIVLPYLLFAALSTALIAAPALIFDLAVDAFDPSPVVVTGMWSALNAMQTAIAAFVTVPVFALLITLIYRDFATLAPPKVIGEAPPPPPVHPET